MLLNMDRIADEIGMLDPQFVRDLADLVVLDRRDRLICRRNREKTLEQRQFLLARRHLVELARDEVIFGLAEQGRLRFRHLHDDDGLLLRQIPDFDDDPLHGAGLLGADVQIRPGDPAQDIGERGDVAGAIGIELVQRFRDLSDGLGFRRGSARGCSSLRNLSIDIGSYDSRQRPVRSVHVSSARRPDVSAVRGEFGARTADEGALRPIWQGRVGGGTRLHQLIRGRMFRSLQSRAPQIRCHQGRHPTDSASDKLA